MFGLLAALSFLAASYAAGKLAAYKRKKGPPGSTPGGGNNTEQPEEVVRRPVDTSQMSREEMLDHIVGSVRFSQAEVIHIEKIGEIRQDSPWPADDIEMRPMRSFSEIPRILPSRHGLPDDLFYGLLATKQLSVRQDIEEVGIFEERHEQRKKTLLVVQDTSGSMSDECRAEWAVELNEKLMDRCLEEDAGYSIQTFNGLPIAFSSVAAGDKKGFRHLRDRLSSLLSPGGGTNIDAALQAAVEHIDGKGYHDVHMILVTDGTQSVDVQMARELLKSGNIHLHTICIAGDNPDLAMVSDAYDVLRT